MREQRMLLGFIGAAVALGVFFGFIKACASCEDSKREGQRMDDARAECIPPGRSEDDREVASCIDVAMSKCFGTSAQRRTCASEIAHEKGLR